MHAAAQAFNRTPGPSAGSGTQLGLLPRLVVDPAFADVLEKRYFQFFRQRTVSRTNDLVDSRFWDRVVLQACHNEPAVKHAVLALSSLHQLHGLPPDSEAARHYSFYADQQYQKALRASQILVASAEPQDADLVLITCIVFICYEGFRGGYRACKVHIDAGRSIVAQNRHRLRHASRRNDLAEIEQALARLDVHAVTFSDSSSPYTYSLIDFYNTAPNLQPGPFSNISEARASFVDLLRWVLLVCTHIDFTASSARSRSHQHFDLEDPAQFAYYQAGRARSGAQMRLWHRHFEDLVQRTQGEPALLVTNLKIWYAAAMALDKARFGPETRWDAVQGHFEQIVELCEKLAGELSSSEDDSSFSLEFGYVMPAFLTATRCRDPVIRRRALKILWASPRQEGMWGSTGAAAIAQRWVEVEEEGLEDIKGASDIPDYRRIRIVDTTVDASYRKATLRWMIGPKTVEDALRLENVQWS